LVEKTLKIWPGFGGSLETLFLGNLFREEGWQKGGGFPGGPFKGWGKKEGLLKIIGEALNPAKNWTGRKGLDGGLEEKEGCGRTFEGGKQGREGFGRGPVLEVSEKAGFFKTPIAEVLTGDFAAGKENEESPFLAKKFPRDFLIKRAGEDFGILGEVSPGAFCEKKEAFGRV